MSPIVTKHYSSHFCNSSLQLTFQGCLNQDIDSFETERSSLSSLAEEGRSVVVMVRWVVLTLVSPCPPAKVFHPAITDTTGALYWAKLLMEILDQKLDSDCQGRILAPQPHSLPR